MTTPAVVTVINMVEGLPESVQNQVVDHLQEYLSDLNDELEWDTVFHASQPKLARLAQDARRQIAAVKASPMDFGKL